MAKWIPTKDFIVLEPPQRFKGKIILPQDRAIGTGELVVWLAGPECKVVKPKDRLLVAPEAVVGLRMDGKDIFITREENVACVLRGEGDNGR